MKNLGTVLLSFAIALLLCGTSLAQSKLPTEAYLAYVTAVQKATSLDEILPYLSKEYRTNLNAQPKDKKPVWLQRLKESTEMTELKINKEAITGKKCTLEGTAISRLGFALKGKVFLVKEGGDWRLDGQGWAT